MTSIAISRHTYENANVSGQNSLPMDLGVYRFIRDSSFNGRPDGMQARRQNKFPAIVLRTRRR